MGETSIQDMKNNLTKLFIYIIENAHLCVKSDRNEYFLEIFNNCGCLNGCTLNEKLDFF